MVVDDVSKDPRYLAGSPLVKSEIVVPIFVKNKLAAELDVESYFTSAFVPRLSWKPARILSENIWAKSKARSRVVPCRDAKP